MLRQRFISGMLLGIILVAVVILAPPLQFAIAFALLFAIGAWEWGRLTSIENLMLRAGYLAAFAAVIAVLWWQRESSLANIWLLLAALFWFSIFRVLHHYHQSQDHLPRWQLKLSLAGLLLLPAAWLAFVELQALHPGWALYIMVLCGVADSFAFLFGKLFGKHKLAPQLSPGKTIEGALGGIGGVLVLAILAGVFWQAFAPRQLLAFVALSLVAGVISIEGDLFESLIKREAGQKDSGRILPGHGGILDRFDSHIAASPLFVLGLQRILG